MNLVEAYIAAFFRSSNHYDSNNFLKIITMYIMTDLKQNMLLGYWFLLFGYLRMTKGLQSNSFDQYRRPNTPIFLR